MEEEARELLKKAGAQVDGVRVRVPPHLIEWAAVRTPPSQITLCDSRDGRLRVQFVGASWILVCALSGGNLMHDVGYLEAGLTSSLEYIVASDELIGMVKRLMGRVEVSEETLGQRANDRVREILETHVPEPLPEEVKEKLSATIERAERGASKGSA